MKEQVTPVTAEHAEMLLFIKNSMSMLQVQK